jgi:tetratricopeptide (TPR) repeat protein
MGEPPPISEQLQLELDQLAAEGDRLAASGNYDDAIGVYQKGFDLIALPKESRNASLWFAVAIGDAQWFAKRHEEGLRTWQDAILIHGGFGNPFIHMRRGQVLFELRNEKEASNELMRALLLGGEDIFATEPIDYWIFITSQANSPKEYPGWIGWPGLDKNSEEYRRWTDPAGVYKFSSVE